MGNIDNLARIYFIAKKYVIQKGFAEEIDWQSELIFEKLNHLDFLREYTWVVLSSGMNEKVITKVFPKIVAVFKDWSNFDYIIENVDAIENEVLQVFNHKLKVNAIVNTSFLVYSKGFNQIKKEIAYNGIEYLKKLPFIGEVTCYHLAKNIGLSYAKPDRHLIRMSNILGFKSPHNMCKIISDRISEKVQVVDLVLWRYATIDKRYKEKLKRLKPLIINL